MAAASLEQIQSRPRIGRPTLPLVLIHDSSGTGFNYHLLENLRRDVYGIEDPLFGTERVWTGGIPEMAKAYATAVVATLGPGPIILGGS
jgi:thioesterase domain-containing protein